MKERPILMSGPMVRAILEGRKTQTRRIIKPQPTKLAGPNFDGLWSDTIDPVVRYFACPYGQPGDRLWVRETFYAFGRWETRFNPKKERDEWHFIDLTETTQAGYRFDKPSSAGVIGRRRSESTILPHWWKRPAIFMPRSASRLTLEIVSVRVERLQEISEEDAMAEGVDVNGPEGNYCAVKEMGPARYQFCNLWSSINGGGSWEQNPLVWVVEFRRVP